MEGDYPLTARSGMYVLLPLEKQGVRLNETRSFAENPCGVRQNCHLNTLCKLLTNYMVERKLRSVEFVKMCTYRGERSHLRIEEGWHESDYLDGGHSHEITSRPP
jgi:hypothetical protein